MSIIVAVVIEEIESQALKKGDGGRDEQTRLRTKS